MRGAGEQGTVREIGDEVSRRLWSSRAEAAAGAASRNRFRSRVSRPEAEPAESHSQWSEHSTIAYVRSPPPGSGSCIGALLPFQAR